MNIVISQPMYFPWVGILEQIRLADHFVFYDDVQFSKGSFVNRVQIKTSSGIKWLTVPLSNLSLGQRIQDVKLDNSKNWQRQHLDMLTQAYAKAPFSSDMLNLVQKVFDTTPQSISGLSSISILALCEYFGIGSACKFFSSSDLHISGSGSKRVLDIVMQLKGSQYITGHGAANYLDHECFSRSGINVEYMDYRKTPYDQLHSEFTPFVSALDLVANLGQDGIEYISSNTMNWREFLSHG